MMASSRSGKEQPEAALRTIHTWSVHAAADRGPHEWSQTTSGATVDPLWTALGGDWANQGQLTVQTEALDRPHVGRAHLLGSLRLPPDRPYAPSI